jgi:phosphoribosylanthranilate isomerase
MFVKICGLTDRASLDAAIDAGADAVGFVFATSAREIAPGAARALCRDLPDSVLRVAVMQHPDPARVRDVIESFGPDCIQTDAGDFAVLDVPGSITCLPVFREGQGIDVQDLPARIVFEGRVSGSGATADWDQAKILAAQRELILAGGLNLDNIDAALEQVRPWGVDVSSGVEYARGRKDPRRIREFVARIRAWELTQ